MAGPAPKYQPIFAVEARALCEQTVRRHNAPQSQVHRAKLALLLAEQPALDNVAAGQRLGKHANWVRYWRKRWATEGFRLTNQGGQGRKPAFPIRIRLRRRVGKGKLQRASWAVLRRP